MDVIPPDIPLFEKTTSCKILHTALSFKDCCRADEESLKMCMRRSERESVQLCLH